MGIGPPGAPGQQMPAQRPLGPPPGMMPPSRGRVPPSGEPACVLPGPASVVLQECIIAMHLDGSVQMSGGWWLQCRLWGMGTLGLCTLCSCLRLVLMPVGFSQKQLIRHVPALQGLLRLCLDRAQTAFCPAACPELHPWAAGSLCRTGAAPPRASSRTPCRGPLVACQTPLW